MRDRYDRGLRYSDEAAKWRKSFREAQVVIEEQNRMLLGVFLRERLTDPTDFEAYVDVATLLDRRGAIVWSRVDLLLAELLERKPHLAAQQSPMPWVSGRRALEWIGTET